MDVKLFKLTFDEIAKNNAFEKVFNGWFKESTEGIITLDLQRSNHGSLYYLNVKIFVQGIFGRCYVKSKYLLKDTGDIFRREPSQYSDYFNLEIPIDTVIRRQGIESLFTEFVVPFINKAMTNSGLIELADQGQIFLLPAVKEYLISKNIDSKL